MDGTPITVLLVSDDAADTGMVRKALAALPDNEWALESVGRLADGVKRIRQGGIAAVLLDLTLSDSQGIDTFAAIFAAAPLLPILVLASPENGPEPREGSRRRRGGSYKDRIRIGWAAPSS